MQIRPATEGDSAAIRDICNRSLRASYSLSPEQIEIIVDSVFSEDALSGRVNDAQGLLLVAEEDGTIVGFAEIARGNTGSLRWLHVDPPARGRGVGTALVERAREKLHDDGMPLTARVLEHASEGGEFLERFDLGPVGGENVDIGGETFYEQVYSVEGTEHEANEPGVEVPQYVEVEGGKHPIDVDEEITGTEAPFFPIREEDESDRWYGFFCAHCGSTSVTADGLDRLECGTCGNMHRPDDWDDAYL